MIHGRYGEFQVLVDGATIVEGGTFAALGVLPSRQTVVDVEAGTFPFRVDSRG